MNYYQITRIGEEPVYVTPEQATKIRQEIQNKAPFIHLPNITIGTSTIKSIEESNVKIESNVPLLTDNRPAGPQISPDGSVKAIWCKKTVSPREWSSYYKNHPSYHRLDSGSSDIVVGFTRIITGDLPSNVSVCSDSEMRYLDAR